MSEMQIGKFQVVGTLGSGAHSKILHIRRAADGRNYALKVVPIDGPEEQKFFDQAEHEFRIGQMLDHPSLIKVYALETVKDWRFRVRKAHLLIEYVNGKTLDVCPRIPIPMLVQVFERVADGMVHMHRRGVYHSDLKPNNIMLSKAGDVKIIDFGLARIKGEVKDRIQGTPEYIAPETAKHKMVNERTDMYNFGATMYRMLTFRLPPSVVSTEDGGLPIDAKTWKKLFKPVDHYNAKVPAPLCDLVHRCLSYEAVKRPERMSEVQGALDHLVEALVKTPEDRLEALEW
ncbi:MAG TPA: serine/threonine protein kinase [Planctomycetales bacterium]|jgi:serine/threonine protein kinase|nr:serine/threonine protein kinase [Planctomycetales bacterium]